MRAQIIPAAAVAALLLGACAETLPAAYSDTRRQSDALTNWHLFVHAFPRPDCTPLVDDLPRDVLDWLHRSGPPPARALVALPASVSLHSTPAAPRFTIVNTDRDDTVFASLWDRGGYARGRAYPGVMELLESEGDTLVVLSARPTTSDNEETFCRLYQRRSACTGISVIPGKLAAIFDSLEMGLNKADALLRQRRDYPSTWTVFNGDSGQGDWIAALIMRDLGGEGARYATIHDVRPWSRDQRNALRMALLESEHLEAIYRGALGLDDGPLEFADELRLDARLSRIRADIDEALGGPGGRLSGDFLRRRSIFLFRNHAELALDLEGAGFISRDDADRIIRAAAPDICLLKANPFGFDRDAAARLSRALSARLQPPNPDVQSASR
jgi:hypothetical protein